MVACGLSAGLAGFVPPAAADVVHVPVDASTIQAGIELAETGDEVVVADGVYTGAGNRNVDFLGRAITVRSANGPANCVVDGGSVVGRHGFVFGTGEGGASRLEGFTIRNFVAIDDGAGVQALGAAPTIVNCVFEACEVLDGNGGALATSGDGILVEGCVFTMNKALRGGALWVEGGGNVVRDCEFESNTALIRGGAASGSGTFVDCRFTGNEVVAEPYVSFFGAGGAVAGTGGLLVLDGCTFEHNSVSALDAALGGAVSSISAIGVEATRCVFRDNAATATEAGFREGLGGAIYSFNAGIRVHGCVFVANRVDGDPRCGPAICHDGDDFEAVNCTVAFNYAEPADDAASVGVDTFAGAVEVVNCVMHGILACGLEIALGQGAADVRYSSIDCVTPGTGNIFGDPMLTDDGHLAPGSPCIDSGSNAAVPPGLTIDIDGDARRQDDPGTPDTGEGAAPIVDMGADEFAAAVCPGDVDGNGDIGFGDVLAVLAAWGPCEACPEDVDGDGDAGFGDVLAILAGWGPCG